MTPTFPNNTPQELITPWWVENTAPGLRSGMLLWAFIPHVDQVPKALVPKGRTQATEHSLVDCEIVPVNSNRLFQISRLPVAGLPIFNREILAVYRAKRRPVLLLVPPYEDNSQKLSPGKPKRLVRPTALVAPYYGVDEGTGKRAGYPQKLVNRIKQCEYPRFIWDKLPLDGTDESILRLDHMMPMSTHHVAFQPTRFELSVEALAVVMEWLEWYLTGLLPEGDDAMLPMIRNMLMDE